MVVSLIVGLLVKLRVYEECLQMLQVIIIFMILTRIFVLRNPLRVPRRHGLRIVI
jgi:hypothetical protein